MSYVKATTFHWHIVDSQSFPLVVPKFPELSAKGAYSVRFCVLQYHFLSLKLFVCMKQPSQVYTPADVKEIVAYAGAVSKRVKVKVSRSNLVAFSVELTSSWKLTLLATRTPFPYRTLSTSHAPTPDHGPHSPLVRHISSLSLIFAFSLRVAQLQSLPRVNFDLHLRP